MNLAFEIISFLIIIFSPEILCIEGLKRSQCQLVHTYIHVSQKIISFIYHTIQYLNFRLIQNNLMK